jgi:hypothetical protein
MGNLWRYCHTVSVADYGDARYLQDLFFLLENATYIFLNVQRSPLTPFAVAGEAKCNEKHTC